MISVFHTENKFIFQLRQNGKFTDDLVVLTNYSIFTYLIQILIMFRYKNIKFYSKGLEPPKLLS